MSRFHECRKFTGKWEFGYVDHPNDRGGATKNGVTQETYDNYRINQNKNVRHVSEMTDEEESEIFYEMYWKPSKAAFISQGLDMCVYDTAVNMGPTRAIKILQRVVGVKEDGIFGPITKKHTDQIFSSNLEMAIRYYCSIRELRYRRIVHNDPSQGVFLNGWINRNDDLKKTAQDQ